MTTRKRNLIRACVAVLILAMLRWYLAVDSRYVSLSSLHQVFAFTSQLDESNIYVWQEQTGLHRVAFLGPAGWTDINLLGYDSASEAWVCIADRNDLADQVLLVGRNRRINTLRLLPGNAILVNSCLRSGNLYVPSAAGGELFVSRYNLHGLLVSRQKYCVPGKKVTGMEPGEPISISREGWLAAHIAFVGRPDRLCVFDDNGRLRKILGSKFASYPVFEPDGPLLAYIDWHPGGSTINIYDTKRDVIDILPTFPPTLIPRLSSSGAIGDVSRVKWSSDGRWLFGEYGHFWSPSTSLFAMTLRDRKRMWCYVPGDVSGSYWHVLPSSLGLTKKN